MVREKLRIVSIAIVVIASGAILSGLRAASKSDSRPTARQMASTSSPKKAEQQFKNIQVLKGIPAEELLPTMQFVASSLGVNCEFCHVKDAFEKDDKQTKKTARKMMEMMFTINQENFDGRRDVTCYSCHRGNAKPVAIPAVMTDDSAIAIAMPHAAPAETKSNDMKEASAPTPEQLLDKYVQAVGGSAVIDKVTSRVMKGTIEFGGQSVPIDIYAKDPDMRISFTHMPGGDSITAFNGHEGWLGTPGRPPHFMQGSEIDAASIDADLHLATHLKQMFSKMAVEGGKVGERDAYVLVGQREAKPPIRLYFDEKSGLLLRLVRYGETALGWLPTQIDYADYRDTNGMNIPYRWTLARLNGRFTIQVSELQQNVPVDDAKFAKPIAPEPANGPAK